MFDALQREEDGSTQAAEKAVREVSCFVRPFILVAKETVA
jgi:hypothetical protein